MGSVGAAVGVAGGDRVAWLQMAWVTAWLATQPAPAALACVVLEAGTRDALPDVEVAVIPEGEEPLLATTGEDGRCHLTEIPAGSHVVRVTRPGYAPLVTLEEFSGGDLLHARYFLRRSVVNRYETVISQKPQHDVAVRSVERAEVARMPGTAGDPLRALEALPSMARAPYLGGALIVRGAPPYATSVLIDGVPVPQLYHFDRLTSVLSAEMVERMDFHPGGFPVSLGRATAGLVEVHTRRVEPSNCRGRASLDVVGTGFFFSCPISLKPRPDAAVASWDTVGVALAARRSFVDALIPPLLALTTPPVVQALVVVPAYWDYQGKLEWRPTKNHTFSLLAFGSDDTLKVMLQANGVAGSYGLSTHRNFQRVALKWEWQMFPGLQFSVLGYAGVDRLDNSLQNGLTATGSTVDERWLGFRPLLRWRIWEGVELRSGVDALAGALTRDATLGPLPLDALIQSVPTGPAAGWGFPRVLPSRAALDYVVGQTQPYAQGVHDQSEHLDLAPHADVTVGPWAGVTVTAGGRAESMRDTAQVRTLVLMPRLSARWAPVQGTVMGVAAGEYAQRAQTIMTSPSLGNPQLPAERSRQLMAGLEQQLAPGVSVSVNTFAGWRRDVAAQHSVAAGQPVAAQFTATGEGRVVGADLMLRAQFPDGLRGWVAYTLSRSEVRDDGNAAWRLFEYDQTHVLTLVGQYPVPWRLPFRAWAVGGRLPRGVWWNSLWAVISGDLTLGARWRWVTGSPALVPANITHDLDTDRFTALPSPSGTTRLPLFHQLDLRADYKVTLDTWSTSAYLEVINAYNRQNVEQVGWDYRFRTQVQTLWLPFFPVAGLSAEF